MLQPINISLHQYESDENLGKFRENFGENFRNVKNSRKKFLRKISRKFRVFFSGKCNVTEHKSMFLCLGKVGKSRKIPGEISGKFHKFRKFAKIFPENFRKIPGKFPENRGVFWGKM
jgi:hypothetical protein